MPDRATVYHRWQFWLGAGGLALTTGVLLAFLGTGTAVSLRRFSGTLGFPSWLQVAMILTALGLILKAAAAPLAWVRGYWLPRRFGLLHQRFRGWCWDRVKGALLGGALALAATEIVYGLLRLTALWWLWAAAIFFAGSALLARVVPTWIVPLFYRLTPLDDAALHDRLVALARRAGIPVVGVWVADQSRKSKTANAALVGLGRTRRIMVFDTLVRSFSADEVESVLAHELGHHVHRDLWRGLGLQGGLTLATFWVAGSLLAWGSERLGLEGLADPAGLPLFALILLGLGLGATPLGNSFSRRMECQADDFALAATANPAAFVRAMERLADLNLAERRPHPLKEMVFFSHPSVDRRIERARGWNATPMLGGAVP